VYLFDYLFEVQKILIKGDILIYMSVEASIFSAYKRGKRD
jgi:hypothetical protein